MTRKVNNWKTKVDETWWADATGPISFEDIDCSNNSRVKGGLYTSEEGLANHLNTVTIGIANRMRTGEPPLKKPCVIMDNPDKTESAKPFILVIGHTRTRGLVNNGFTEYDFVHVRGKVLKDPLHLKRFMIYNNDHDEPSVSNSDECIRAQIDEEFKDLMSQGYKLVDHKKTMRLQVNAVMNEQVAYNKTPAQVRLMVEKWIEQQEQDPNSGHVTKFKAYGNAEAKIVAQSLIDLPGLKINEKVLSDANNILQVADLTKGSATRAWQYAYTTRLLNPKKKIIIAAYFATTKLNSASDLKKARDAAVITWNDLKEKDKKRLGLTKNYRPVADQIFFLPQCVDPEDYPEDECKLILGPW